MRLKRLPASCEGLERVADLGRPFRATDEVAHRIGRRWRFVRREIEAWLLAS